MFIFIASTDGTDMLVNTDHIQAVKQTKRGCIVIMRDNAFVESGVSAEEMMGAIVRATTNLEVRHEQI